MAGIMHRTDEKEGSLEAPRKCSHNSVYKSGFQFQDMERGILTS